MRDPLLLVQPRGDVLDSEPLAALSQAAHLDQRVGEVAVLLGIGTGAVKIRARNLLLKCKKVFFFLPPLVDLDFRLLRTAKIEENYCFSEVSQKSTRDVSDPGSGLNRTCMTTVCSLIHLCRDDASSLYCWT